MGAVKTKKIHEKEKLCLWEHSSCDGGTWYTINENDMCNSLEEICYAYNGKEVDLVNEVMKRGNKVVFSGNASSASYEDYIAQFDNYEKVKNPIYPYCCFETYEKAREICDLLEE